LCWIAPGAQPLATTISRLGHVVAVLVGEQDDLPLARDEDAAAEADSPAA
jgi:hypothetical protein